MDETTRFLVRPHTHDEDPHPEAQIKTLKYRPRLLSLQILGVYESIRHHSSWQTDAVGGVFFRFSYFIR